MKKYLLRFCVIILAAVLTGFMTYRLLSGGLPARHEAVKQIPQLTAPTFQSFGPQLLLDGVENAVNAWHAPVNPQYPIPIDAVFPKKIQLTQIGFQSQYDASNFLRAPLKVEIYGGEDAEHLEKITAAELVFETAGAWARLDFQKTKSPYRHYRIMILSNHGDANFVTLQELEFLGRS